MVTTVVDVATKRNRALMLTVGFPCSGKTTWAKRTGFAIVCPDSIRLALHGQTFLVLAEPIVWAIAKVMVRALFLSGALSVVLDATSTTRAMRSLWLSDDWETYYKLIETTRDTCIFRAGENLMFDLVPVIEKMNLEFEGLDDEEIKRNRGRS